MARVGQAERLIKKGGHAHLMGVGGIGMAGLAWLLRERGFRVSGCDLQQNAQTGWLAENGVEFFSGHKKEHVSAEVDWVIRSTAVPDSHPEIAAALTLNIPVSRRGDVLAALMRGRTCIAVCGTHGKTTTTAIIAQILHCGYFVGGEIGGNPAVAKEGEIMAVEADESDGTLSGYSPDFAVITNIEYDHMEHHASEAAFIGCFERLIAQTKKRVYYCAGDPIASKLCAGNPKCTPYQFPEIPLQIPLPGKHNQWNAAGALAVAENWLPREKLLERLKTVQPVGRRFETVYHQNEIRIISDYAHHPTEIAALIQTALELNPKRLLGIFQPHRYTRTLALGPDFPPSFDGLEKLWLVPVYAASETPLEGGTSLDLMNRFDEKRRADVVFCESLELVWNTIKTELKPGDLLLIIGAGDIVKVAEWARRFDRDTTERKVSSTSTALRRAGAVRSAHPNKFF